MAFNESEDVRLARVEEGLVALRGEVREYHGTVKSIVQPMQEKVHVHSTAIAILKRDRWWLFTLVGAAFTSGLFAIFHGSP